MKIYCIVDNLDLGVGLKFSGCDVTILNKSEEVEEKIDKVLKSNEYGILVLTESIYELQKQKVDEIMLKRKIPLISII